MSINRNLSNLANDVNSSGVLEITGGGTGASTAPNARTNLGLGTAATTDSTAYATAAQGTKADNAVSDITSIDGSVVISPTGTSHDLSVGTAGSTGNLIAQVRNQTGATLTKGTLVYITGGSGNKALVSKSQANAESTSAKTLGMISADINNNQNGYATVTGQVSGLDTSAWVEGTVLYLSPTVAGGYTNTKPVAPNHMVYIGTVVYQHANQGTIQARIQNGYELDELHDVLITSVATNDFLVHNGTVWVNKTPANARTSLGLAASATTDTTNADNITSGTIAAARLPSYVDDVLEYANLAAFPATGETGKIYVALDTNKTYRWSGTVYVYITSGAVDSVGGATGVVTATNLLDAIKTVDGTTSGLDADLLDGNHASAFYLATNPSGYTTNTGTVTSVATGTGLSGGTITGTGTISLANTAVTAGSYTATNLTVDAQGRITAASSGTSGGVTSVTGTAPVVSSGGTTPAISMAAATTSVNGYLTSTDWNTFNGKQAALGFTPYNSTNPSGYISSITSGNVTTALGYTPYNSTNPSGYITGITSGNVTTALGFTPYNATNPSGYITGITSGNVTTALGYTPYNSTNPSGYTTNTGTVTSVGGTGTVAGISLSGTVTTTGNLTLGGTFALPSSQVTGKMIYDSFTATASQTSFTTSNTYTSGKIQVFCNGVKMVNGSDVTVTSGTAVVFAVGLGVGSLVDLVYPI